MNFLLQLGYRFCLGRDGLLLFSDLSLQRSHVVDVAHCPFDFALLDYFLQLVREDDRFLKGELNILIGYSDQRNF